MKYIIKMRDSQGVIYWRKGDKLTLKKGSAHRFTVKSLAELQVEALRMRYDSLSDFEVLAVDE